MPVIGWAEVLALLTSIGYGVMSAIFPPANAEAYVVASQVAALAGTVPVAVGVSIGQTVGKLLLFVGVRRGRESRLFRERRAAAKAVAVGPLRTKVRAWVATLLGLIGQKRWGLPIVALSAVLGFPPLYAVALLAGATRMRIHWFGLVVLGGRIVRFVLIAVGGHTLTLW